MRYFVDNLLKIRYAIPYTTPDARIPLQPICLRTESANARFQAISELRLALHGSHFVVTREPPSTLASLTSEENAKSDNFELCRREHFNREEES
jgi:hypothetical protein